NHHGFDFFYGFQNPSYGDKAKRLIQRNQKVVDKGPESSRITDDLTGEAVNFIQRNKEQPFFLYLAHDMPHVPLELPSERRGISKGGFYGDVIEHLDWSVGQVLDALKDNGLEKDTIVVFTSDNGPAIHWSIEAGSAAPLRGSKHTTLEGGFRVPGIAWGPGRIPRARVSSEMVTIMDLLPTFTKLVGGTVPSDRVIDGKDIWPVLSGASDAASPHEALYFYKRDKKAGHIEGVRWGDWKLRVPLKSYHDKAKLWKDGFKLADYTFDKDGKLPTWRERIKIAVSNLQKIQLEAAKEKIGLYNLAEDVGERVNLASQHPDKVKQLKAMMEEFDVNLRASSRPCGNTRTKK
ncbi:MAG: sulfatase-like hydrolase/transferase, partial [Verrucomicrobiae bacterium]|nr:sulfatase-like hydrolase/transferase [Verrucomicrobiae bacterium]NNJ86776.1 sulfatase-like hydrolase/transferase [Akkermansiaceae bacterium]